MDEQIKQLVDAMNEQGASQEEIQRAISSMGSGTNPEESPEKKGIIQEIAEPFLKIPTTVAAGFGRAIAGASAAIMPGGMTGKEAANRAQQEAIKGLDYGFFGNVKPIGAEQLDRFNSGDISGAEYAKLAALEYSGTMAEVASYGVAPLKAVKGAGFFQTAFKQGGKFSAMFGAGKALQAAGEGKSGADAALEGAGAFLGSALGYGITGKAASFIGNWGARALQSEAVRMAGGQIRNLAEKVWTALPEAFQKVGADLVDNVVNSSTRRSLNALRSEYAQVHTDATRAFIDDAIPNVDRPDLQLGQFQRSLSAEMGSNFRRTNKLYDDFKAAEPITDSIGQWTNSSTVLQKGMGKNINPEISYLFRGIQESLKKPTSPRMVLSTWESLMSLVPKVTNEEKVIVRDAADALYRDMRNILQTKDKSLLNTWDEAYQSWKRSVDIYESNPLNQLKSTGDVDTIVDKMASKTLTRAEQDTILSAMKSDPESIRQLFVGSLLRKAKDLPPNEGAKLVRNFLDSWDFKSSTGDVSNVFLDPKQAKYLDDLSNYMDENFNDFVLGMREATGLAGEKAGDLAEKKAQLAIGDLVDKGDFEGIAQNWLKISGTDDFSKALETLSPEERRVVGLSLFRKVYDEKLPLIQLNKDGTLNVSAFADAFKGAMTEIDRMGGAKKSNKLLKQLYTDEQITDMLAAKKMVDTLKDVQELPVGSAKKLMHGVIALFYSTLGQKYIGATARHTGEAVTAPSAKEFYQGIDTLIDQGLLKNNFKMTVGDFLDALRIPSGAAGGTGVSEII